MKKMMLKLSPLFFLLLLFSCTKDNDLGTIEKGTEILQSRESGGGEGPCNTPCRQPDFIQISDVTPCEAVITWGHTAESCGTFSVQVQNLVTGVWTVYNPAVSPLTITGLDRCTAYNVRIFHLTKNCESLPIEKSFITDCRYCRECTIDCRNPDYFSVNNITETGATVNFGFNSNACGYFVAELKNNDTGAMSSTNPATSPLVLTGLDPCTSYTIGIAHVTDICSTEPITIDFMTECPVYCDATSLDPSCLHTQYIDLDFGITPGNIWVLPFSSQGYVDATNQEVNTTPGAILSPTTAGFCHCGNLSGDIYMKLWIDANQNTLFEASELMYTVNIQLSGGGNTTVSCFDRIMPNVTIPNIVACGLRARFIISQDPDAGPCGTFATGQVVDFSINTQNCDI